jgi:RNA polymerase sigma factor (sigma-70 family)
MPDSTGDNMSAELRSHPADADLVQASREGEPRAFEQLVERHFPMVYAIAYARLGQAEAAEDLAQEVFLRAHLFLHSLEFPDRFAGWLSRIARNEAISWLRARQRSSRLVRMVPLEGFMEEHIESQEKGARERMSAKEEARAAGIKSVQVPGVCFFRLALSAFEGGQARLPVSICGLAKRPEKAGFARPSIRAFLGHFFLICWDGWYNRLRQYEAGR